MSIVDLNKQNQLKKHINNYVRIIAILTCWVLVQLYSAQSYASPVTISPNDTREYAYLKLANGLQTILVSDHKAKMSAATMAINVGSFADPKDTLGLAHFLEHMLFLGTKNYPDPDNFHQYLTLNGGGRNAMTANDKTLFYFYIQPEAFVGAINRFSEFFYAPKLDATRMEKEINAIEAEFSMHQNQDNWRALDVNKATSNPDHPFFRFSIGNRQTLSQDKEILQAKLNTFIKQHYSASNMRLVLVGPQSIAELKKLANKFNKIPKTTENIKIQENLVYTKDNTKIDLKVKAVGDKPQTDFSFILPSYQNHYKAKPVNIIAELIGHEGEGSILSALKNKGYITDLSVSYGKISNLQDLLNIQVTLTPMGQDNLDEITKYILSYVELLKTQGVPNYFIDEIVKINQLKFRYLERNLPVAQANLLASNMLDYPVRDLITASFLRKKQENLTKLIPEVLNELTIENLRRVTLVQELTKSRTTDYFKVDYNTEGFSESLLRFAKKPKIYPELKLPEKNKFVPDNLKISEIPEQLSKYPQKIHVGQTNLWYKQDVTFRTPEADLFILLGTKYAYNTPENAVKTALMSMLALDEINHIMYPAFLAGTSFNAYSHARGITLSVHGFTQSQDQILQILLDAMQNLNFDPQKVARLKTKLANQFLQYQQAALYSQAVTSLNAAIINPSWHPMELYKQLNKLSINDLKQFADDFYNDLHLEILVHGNYTQKQAKKLAEILDNSFDTKASTNGVPKSQTIKLDINKTSYLNINNKNTKDHALAWYLQLPRENLTEPYDLNKLAKTILLTKIIEAPFYQKLRVEEQLAYALGVSPIIGTPYSGIIFYIQSPNVKSMDLYTRFNSFLINFAENINVLDKNNFDNFKRSLINDLKRPATDLLEQSIKYWGYIEDGTLMFDKRDLLINELMNLELSEFVEFTQQFKDPAQFGQFVSGNKLQSVPANWSLLD